MKHKGIIFASVHLIAILALTLVSGILNTNFNPSELPTSETGEEDLGVFKVDDKGELMLEQNRVIQVLENDTAIKQGYLKELIDAFNQAYASYGIVAKDANLDEMSNLEQDGPDGYGPDVIYQANDRLMNYVDGRHILPIPKSLINDLSSYGSKSIETFSRTINEKTQVFAVPVNIQGSLLYYRKDLLPQDWKTAWDTNNNDVPDMLESWNAMYKYSSMLKNDNDPKTFGYMRSFLEPYFSAGYLFSYGGYAFGNNNTDPYDIGFSKGESWKGASVIRQQASVMDSRAIDDTVTVTAYAKLAEGEFFATITTPDVYTLFKDELNKKIPDSRQNLDDYLGIADVPYLPKSGDLSEENPELIPTKMMGGVHGYAISSYTKSPNASLAFVNFATQYEMIKRRNELLGIAPAREDVASDVGGLSEIINSNLEEGNISIMPSIKAVGQIWTPLQTFFQDLAKDPTRPTNEMKYLTKESLEKKLKEIDEQIYKAIHTLQ